MQILKQSDSHWGNKRLGSGSANKTTIGSHGCTITCLAMLAGINPDEVNDRLNNVGGYASSGTNCNNLVLWTKIQAAIPWLQFEYRYDNYDNEKVKSVIAKNGGCLVCVNASPIGGTTHWVLYIGNQKLYDPFDGKEKSTSSYKPIRFTTINVVGSPSKSVEVDDKTFEQLVTKSTKYDEFIKAGYDSVEKVIQDVKDLSAKLQNAENGAVDKVVIKELLEKALERVK